MNLYFRLVMLFLRRLRAKPVSLWGEVTTTFRVTLTDLDVLRHMNNAKYLALLDLGRTDLMLRSGFGRELARRGWYPVVSAQTISYKRSLTLGQRFELVTRALGVDDRSVYLRQEFRRKGKVVARAIVQARFLRSGGGGVVPPEEIIEAVGGIPDDLVLPEWIHDWAEHVRISSTER